MAILQVLHGNSTHQVLQKEWQQTTWLMIEALGNTTTALSSPGIHAVFLQPTEIKIFNFVHYWINKKRCLWKENIQTIVTLVKIKKYSIYLFQFTIIVLQLNAINEFLKNLVLLFICAPYLFIISALYVFCFCLKTILTSWPHFKLERICNSILFSVLFVQSFLYYLPPDTVK